MGLHAWPKTTDEIIRRFKLIERKMQAPGKGKGRKREFEMVNTNIFKGTWMGVCWLAFLLFSWPAQANNLVVNGGFETTTFGAGQLTWNTDATGWTLANPGGTTSSTYLFTPGEADSAGANGEGGNVALCGPNNIPGPYPATMNGLPATKSRGGQLCRPESGLSTQRAPANR